MILRPTTEADCLVLPRILRDCDRKEIALGSGRKPLAVMFASWRASTICETIETPDNRIAGIWGIVPISPGVGSIWMLGSHALEDIPMSFLRASRRRIESSARTYPLLLCAPWRENALHLRWLRWLGFTLEEVGHPHFLKASRHV